MTKNDKRSVSSPLNGQNGGVKTSEGKMISSQNAFKHGILANFSTKFDDVTFEEAFQMYSGEFGADTPSRQALVSQLAILHIRLRRCARFESEFIREKLNPPKYEKKLVKKGMKFDVFDSVDEFESVLVAPGDPMTLDPEKLTGLENVYTKYESQFLSRFCHIIEFLTRSAK